MSQAIDHDYALPPVQLNSLNADPVIDQENDNDVDRPSHRYNNMQRNLIFTAVIIAKRERNIPPIDDSVDYATYRRTLEILEEPGFSAVGKTPIIKTVRSIVAISLRPLKPLLDRSNWKRMGRPEHELTSAVEYCIESDELRSSYQIAAALGDIDSRTVRRKVKQLGYRRYNIPHGQHMPDDGPERRVAFAFEYRQKVISGELDPENVLFSDKCLVGFGSLNRHNSGIYRPNGYFHDQLDQVHSVQAQTKRVHVFVGLHPKIGVIGPHYIDEIELCEEDGDELDDFIEGDNLNAAKYIKLLRFTVLPELESKLNAIDPTLYPRMWFQQDGAAAHTSHKTLAFLQSIFDHRIISNKTNFAWPPYSPDLNPLDFFFWSNMKEDMLKHDNGPLPSRDRTEIKHYTALACNSIHLKQDWWKKALAEFPIRLECMLHEGGGYFEPVIAQFKLQVRAQRQNATTCNQCNSYHLIDCDKCLNRCAYITAMQLINQCDF